LNDIYVFVVYGRSKFPKLEFENITFS